MLSRQLFDAEQHVKTNERFHFCERCFEPFAVRSCSDAFLNIVVCFDDNMLHKFFWEHQVKEINCSSILCNARSWASTAVNGKTSTGFAFSFHVSSSSLESDKFERTSLATEETKISDSESLWFLASNLACLHAATASQSTSTNPKKTSSS